MVRRVREGMAALFALPEGYEVVLGNGGATAFWDAATFGLVRERSQHLVFGEFSAKFADSRHAARRSSATRRWSPATRATPRLRRRGRASTPTARRTTRPRPASRRPVRRPVGTDAGALVLVDATSGRRRPAGRPGAGRRLLLRAAEVLRLATAGCGWRCSRPPRIERVAAGQGAAGWVPAFLDLGIALDNSRLDQTYNTPALATIFLLAEQVDWMNAPGGLPGACRAPRSPRRPLYGWAEKSSYATPFVADPQKRSARRRHDRLRPTSIDAAAVAKVLRANGDRRHRAVPQAGPQPAAHRDVPGGRARPTSRRSPAASTGSSTGCRAARASHSSGQAARRS